VAVAILVAGFGSISFAQNLDESKWGKNTPGVELATHEGPRERTSSGTVLIYNILGKGFPADKKYDLWFWKLGQSPQNAIQGASFDKHGLLVCSGKPGFCKGAVADDAVNIKATATLGEPKRFAVISADGTVAGFADAVPFPLEASDKGCRLSVVREAADAAVVAVRVRGFAPNEPLIVKTNPPSRLGSQPGVIFRRHVAGHDANQVSRAVIRHRKHPGLRQSLLSRAQLQLGRRQRKAAVTTSFSLDNPRIPEPATSRR